MGQKICQMYVTQLTSAFSSRQTNGNCPTDVGDCTCKVKATTDAATESAKSGIFSKVIRQNDFKSTMRLSGQQSRSSRTAGVVTSIGFDMSPQANKIDIRR